MILSEAARIVGMTPDALRRAVLQGRVLAEKSGTMWLVKHSDLMQALADGKIRPGTGRPRRQKPN